MIIHSVNQALWLALIMSAPIVLVCAFIGLFFGFIQAILQLQDQSLPFALKLVFSTLIMIFLGPYISGRLMNYSLMILEQL